MSQAREDMVEVYRAELHQLLSHLEKLKEMRLCTLRHKSKGPIKNIGNAQLRILNLWISRLEKILAWR